MFDIHDFSDAKPLDPLAKEKGRIELEWIGSRCEAGCSYMASVINPFTKLRCEYGVIVKREISEDGVFGKVFRSCYVPEVNKNVSEIIHVYKVLDPHMETADLIRIAEEHFYDEVERYKKSNANDKANSETSEQGDNVIHIEVPAGKTIQIAITTKDV
jgi:hypothetical protein